jgi:hypothetical protein
MRVFARGRQVVYAPGSTVGTPGDIVEITGLPWAPADIINLKFSQSADVITVTHPNYPPYHIQRYGHDDWGVVLYNPSEGPFAEVNTDPSKYVFASAPDVGAAITLTASTPIFKTEHSGKFFFMEQRDFGKPWMVDKAVAAGQRVRSEGKYYRALASGTTGTLRPSHGEGKEHDGGVWWEYLHSGFGVAKLGTIDSADGTATASATVIRRIPDAVAQNTDTSFRSTNITDIVDNGDTTLLFVGSTVGFPEATFFATVTVLFLNDSGGQVQITQTAECTNSGSDAMTCSILWSNFVDQGYTDFISGTVHYQGAGGSDVEDPYTHKWAFGAWGGASGWPSCSTYFQQRQVFGGSPLYPQSVWMTRTNSYADFSTSNPILDDDALTLTLASSQIDQVRSLFSLDRLVMFTQGGNWVTGSGQDDVITPANISAKLQNYYGAGSLAPLGVGNAVLYYGSGGTIRDMGYDYASDSYSGNDLTVLSPHLFENHYLVDWTFQTSPFPIIWGVREDGVLLGGTYLKDQQVIGWHQHSIGGGTVESVCVINECRQDHLYMIVYRNGVRSIEYISNRIDDLYEQFFVDSGVTYDGRNLYGGNVTVTGGTAWTSAETLTITYTPATNYPTIFTTGAPSTDIGDQIVLEGSDGLLYRIVIVGVTSTTVATGTLVGTGTLHSSLRGTGTTSWAFARDSVGNLTHLNGQTVDVYSDGVALAQQVVSGGLISLAGNPGFVVHVGLPITAEAETLAITMAGQDGPAVEHKKLVTGVYMTLENSRSVKVGQNSSNLMEGVIGSTEYEQSGGVQTGIMECRIPASWTRPGKVFIRHTSPTALSILSIIPELAVPKAPS